MRIPSTQKARVEDFPDQKEWIGKLINVYNKFLNDTITSVNGNIEFEKNILGVENEFDFVYVNPTLSLPLVFTWNIATSPRALYVVSASENTPTVNRDFTPIICNVAWFLNPSNEVSISDIIKFNGTTGTASALVAKNRYKLRVRVTP